MSKKILVIDDEKNILLTLNLILRNEGYDVLVASDSLDGVIKAGELKPDLILLDICLPRVDGYSVCRSLRCDVDIDKIPIVFMSSKNQEEDIKEAFDSGGNDYLLKPFTKEKLLDIVEKNISKGEK
ncbi:response regulator [Fusobacterium ulcerans]|jgi:PleD family two-component response regulator|uniref:Transcriptional regulatory protein YycF n=1 Tax=Fusobacterium ulcerans TaxID=861 RepID=A0AAX2J875_9FUSO|nr:response regulator [Fusobacterium ulcerans]AVQ28126.1 response regulator [Fusobacterium ulcerans]SQI99825.1 Transcriptional regulatory protein YycF [Fusobacterium ulcerans]